jgi:hypothetical protein
MIADTGVGRLRGSMQDIHELDLDEQRGFIYRFWAGDGGCLYVGQHRGFHVASRVLQHQSKDWWPGVAKIDYFESDLANLDAVELEQIRELEPKHNRSRVARKVRLTDAQVRGVHASVLRPGTGDTREYAQMLGVHHKTIRMIRTGQIRRKAIPKPH